VLKIWYNVIRTLNNMTIFPKQGKQRWVFLSDCQPTARRSEPTHRRVTPNAQHAPDIDRVYPELVDGIWYRVNEN